MIDELIDMMGLTNLVLAIVGVALLIVVLLLMSYFRTLVAISNFTFPNAKFRAHGIHFIEREKVEPIVESRNINELYQAIRETGYELPKEETGDIDEVEQRLENNNVEYMKKAYRISPLETKPFVEAWLARYDVKMAKKAIKFISRGGDPEYLKNYLIPVRIIDEDVIDELSSSRNLQEAVTILKETEFGEILGKEEWGDDFFKLDMELDIFAFEKLRKAVTNVESEQRPPVKYFFGRYTDLLNLKMIIRGIREGIEQETMKAYLLPPGRELENWKLNQMLESSNLEEALVELEGTSFEAVRKKAASKSHFEIERYLDEELLNMASEVMSQQVLTVGPLLRFLVGKEIELRNLKILVRGLKEGLDPDKIRNMLILEGYQ
ncbi:MAG: V-type ATPase subunit [Candidatus Saliniplasma sp.]